MYFCIKSSIGTQGELASCKSALNPMLVYSTDVLRRWPRCYSYSLLLCGLFYKAICFMSYLACHFVLVFFSPFSIAITSLGEERANLSAFRRFVRLCLFGFVGFLFLLVSGKGCGL